LPVTRGAASPEGGLGRRDGGGRNAPGETRRGYLTANQPRRPSPAAPAARPEVSGGSDSALSSYARGARLDTPSRGSLVHGMVGHPPADDMDHQGESSSSRRRSVIASTQDLGGSSSRRLNDLLLRLLQRKICLLCETFFDNDDMIMSLAEEQQPPAPAVPAAGPLPDAVKEEELMSSVHELHESFTCPLCCLPIVQPFGKHSSWETCCMKRVCDGCSLASYKRGMGSMCAFCRTPTPDSDAATLALVRKRVDAKDPKAIEFLAQLYYYGNHGLRKDIPRACELWKESARLGDLGAHNRLGYRYYHGEGVQQDIDRGIRHWQHAAIQGHPDSRFMLGIHECENGNHELAVQHLMISAKMGDDHPIKGL
ncbi:hypothetical protein THAOC_18810, partial [Thalassiosira oceanica]